VVQFIISGQLVHRRGVGVWTVLERTVTKTDPAYACSGRESSICVDVVHFTKPCLLPLATSISGTEGNFQRRYCPSPPGRLQTPPDLLDISCCLGRRFHGAFHAQRVILPPICYWHSSPSSLTRRGCGGGPFCWTWRVVPVFQPLLWHSGEVDLHTQEE
jgi:hypothetical protein